MPQRRLVWVSELVSIIFLTLIALVFFNRFFLQGKLPIPTDALVGRYHPWREALSKEYPLGVPYRNFLITDPFRQQIPWRKAVIDAYKQGGMPGWDPSSFGGSPLKYNNQAAPYYWLNSLFLIFNFQQAWALLIFSQTWGMLVFTYGYLRSEKLGIFASLIGSITAAFCGFCVAWLYWGTMVATLMWMPFILWILRTTKEKDSKKRILVRTLLMMFGLWNLLTAGHIQIAIYSLIVCILYTFSLFRKNKIKGLWQIWIYAGLAILLLLTQYVTSFGQFFLTTVRGNVTTSWQTEGFFIPIKHLIQFIAPDYFGNPGRFNYWSTWNYGELVGYVGAVGLTLALVGGHELWRKNRFWVLMVLGAILLSLNTPLAWIPYVIKIPIWSSLQPTRLLGVVGFGLAVLAAYGFEAIRYKPEAVKLLQKLLFGLLYLCLTLTVVAYFGIGFNKSEWTMIALRNLVLPITFLGLIGIVTVSQWWLKRGKSKWAGLIWNSLLVIVVVDLFSFAWKFLPFTNPQFFFPQTEILSWLQQQPKPFRIMTTDVEVLPTNTLAWYGLEEVGGYNPIYTQRYARFFGALQNGKYNDEKLDFQRLFDPNNYTSPLLKYVDVNYLISLKPIEPLANSMVINEGETYVYTLPNPLGRWYLADEILTATNGGQLLTAMIDGKTNGQRPAFVEANLENNFGSGLIEPLRYTPNSQKLKVKANEQVYLVSSNAWDRGWKAYIDGKQTQIYPTNYLFMGLIVPEGIHEIELSYE